MCTKVEEQYTPKSYNNVTITNLILVIPQN